MFAFIIPILIGILCIVLGIINTTGNISSLHSYHRHRVSEEDRIPFGRRVGAGTIIIGASIVVMGVLSTVGVMTSNDIYTLIGTGIMLVGLAVGIFITFRAMIKYNKGIF